MKKKKLKKNVQGQYHHADFLWRDYFKQCYSHTPLDWLYGLTSQFEKNILVKLTII